MMGIKDFFVIPSEAEEQLDGDLLPGEAVRSLALSKGIDVWENYGKPGDIVISGDTLVYLDGTPLGKPSNEEEAYNMLKSLSGREHTVHTGVAVIKDGLKLSATENAQVFFREMTDDEIRTYIKTGEPMDKAGAYGIQGLGGVFIEKIYGDFFTVMGLPMCRLYSMLKEAGFDSLKSVI